MTKTKLFNWLFALIVLVAGLNLASCSDDDYLPGEEEKVHVPNANLLGQSRCTQLAVFRKQGHDFLPTFLCFLPTFFRNRDCASGENATCNLQLSLKVGFMRERVFSALYIPK